MNGLRNLRAISKKERRFARKSTTAADTAYNNALRIVLSVPFEIQSCQSDSACSKVNFTASTAAYTQASSALKKLAEKVATKLSKSKGTRAVKSAKKLRNKSTKLYNANLNGTAALHAMDCSGGKGIVPTPIPTIQPTVNPEDNPLLRTMAGHWNHVAINASGFDHTALGTKEQLGPVRSARAMAIVHIAIFDAVNAATGQRYEPYLLNETRPGASVDAAIAYASYETLSKLYPSQASDFAKELLTDLAGIPNDQAKEDGIHLGKEAARLILADRANDGSDALSQDEPYEFREGPGFWSIDPINPDQTPLGANWYKVRPFIIPSASVVRSKPFPALTSDEYAEAYAEVLRLGGDGKTTPTERTQDQTEAGIFWAYDGTPSLCAPPKLFNQIAMHIANQEGLTDVVELTRMLALVNVSMADAGLASWETKYHYNIWRPITAIRQGHLDNNPNTPRIENWTPLGAPASNLSGPNFTPPFPAYVSGHATFGGAVFQTLRNILGTDNISFTFVSDEMNGITPGNDGVVRPKKPRSFKTLSQAEEENGQSRIYLGIHWSFDKTEGIKMGRTVANYILLNRFRPRN
ncbi:MAG: phosphatase PAP2 family protein [Deltaproteobacteria bacterium]|nr:phosphatase PAP2 family protein [Deltaproteobacteria bacterium]